MWRLMIVVFGFLGLSFYELSGGDEFSAEAWPEAKKAEPVVVADLKSDVVAPEVALVSVSTKNTNDETIQLAPLTDPKKVETVVAATEPTVQPVVEEAPKDIRKVKGTRVNFRNGPGKTYSVVGKLKGGERTLVLTDPGEGWVKIRTEGGKVGWIADFLLTAS